MLTDRDLDALVADANPLGERELAALGLGAAEEELRAALAAPALVRSRRRRRLRRPLAGALALAAAVALVLVMLPEGSPRRASSAWAAPLVHLAESSPLLLLDAPGWTVTRADETDDIEGEMTFTNGNRNADLHWRRGPLALWQRDRAHDAAMVTHRTVLGARAQISQYPQSTDFAAVWPEDGRVLEFRAQTEDLAAFERLLGSLSRVDVDTWLSAMPPSVIKAGDRAAAVRAMLADIPQPPGFDAALPESGVLKDRYQLGAEVTGAVACAWIKRWDRARDRGDAATARGAVDALNTSHRWRILREMQSGGAWPEVLWETVTAMQTGDGTWYGRDLWTEVQTGLGCGR